MRRGRAWPTGIYILNYCTLQYVDSGTSSNHAQNDGPENIIISVVITFLLTLPLGILAGCCVCGLWTRQRKSGDPEEAIYDLGTSTDEGSALRILSELPHRGGPTHREVYTAGVDQEVKKRSKLQEQFVQTDSTPLFLHGYTFKYCQVPC